MSNLHKDWILSAVKGDLARTAEATITVRDVPEKGKTVEVPFEKVEFAIDSGDEMLALWTLAEASRTTVKDDDGKDVQTENPINTLLTYAYGLNCRAKVRAEYERGFEDPDKAIKKIAESLVKSGRFKSFDKALAAAKMLQETEDE